MSAPKYTPGPWKPCRAHEDYEGPLFDIDEEDAATYAARPFVRIEAETCDVAAAHDLFEFDAANAYLIAAAPELYAKAERLYNLTAPFGYAKPEEVQEAREALRLELVKARGEA